MTVLAIYLLKVLICSGVLCLYYYFFLRNKLFHQWNRFYLLSAVVLSLLLPLIQIEIFQNESGSKEVIQFILIGKSTDHYLDEFIMTNHTRISTDSWMMLLYASVSVVFLFSIVYSVYRIFYIIRTHTTRILYNIKFISTQVKGAPFSFLNYIFWNDEIPLQTESGQQIFQHELVHVQEKHTWDKLFMQFVIALFWCNPFFWLIRKELEYIHEFIADKKAVGEAGTEAFAAMILQSVYPQQFQSITNQFFHTSIKRRIFMLSQLKNTKIAYVSRVVALPIVALLILSFTIRTKETNNNISTFNSISIGGSDTIPKKEKDISSVNVSSTKKEITITYLDGTKEIMSENEAHRRGLIHNNGYGNQKTTVASQGQNSSIRIKDLENPPLFLMDGKEVNKESVDKIDPHLIQSINVLKGANASDKYGDKARNGAVEITTKKQASNEPLTLKADGKELTKSNVTNQQVPSEAVAADVREVTVVGFQSNKNTDNKNEPIFEKAEFMPSIDMKEWSAFLEKYSSPIIAYAANKGLPGGNHTIKVRFIVEKDGTLSNVSIINDPGNGIGDKIVVMMKFAPKWKPAIQNQKVVRSYHIQPITLQIHESNPDVTFNKNTND